MYNIEIIFPENVGRGVGVDHKREYLRKIFSWGVENLDDPNGTWRNFLVAIDQIYMSHSTIGIDFNVDTEEDAMALKLARS